MPEPALPYTRLGTGAPLAVFPGLFGRTDVPRWFLSRLQRNEVAELARGREVWSIDRRFGLEPGITMRQLAVEHAQALRDLFDEPIDLVGISTGGSIALQLAADHPELIRRLVLVSSAYRLSDRGRATQLRIAALLRANRSRLAASVFLSNTAAGDAEAAILSLAGLVAPRLVVGNQDPDLLATLDCEDSFDLGDRVGTIHVPTMIVGGGRDRFYGSAMFEATHERMPGSILKLNRRAGHLTVLGNRPLAREILEFLEVSDDSSSARR